MPKKPDQDRIREYAEKWLKGEISPVEKSIFEQWYNEVPDHEDSWESMETESAFRERIFGQVIQKIHQENETVPFRIPKRAAIRRIIAVAAMLLVTVGLYHVTRDTVRLPESGSPVVLKDNKILDQTTAYTRHLKLPDGSTVILNANSKIEYSGNFSGKSREVILVGEAYFDIQHDASRPFIIHTGGIRTTVLGTAFNINADPAGKKIVISVTRGKVKVENKSKLLAILTPNEQVVCSDDSSAAEKNLIKPEISVIDWTRQDMVFEDVSFREIVELLNRRYGVNIRFKNPELEKCTIKAFFSGLEPLEKVLDVLSIISNSSYTAIDQKNFLLDGKGCGE